MRNAQEPLLTTVDIDELINDLRVIPGVHMGIPGLSLNLPVEDITNALVGTGIDFLSLLGREPSMYPHAHVPVTAALAKALNNSLFATVNPGCPDARKDYYLSLSVNYQLHVFRNRSIAAPRLLAVLTEAQVQQLLKNFVFSLQRELKANAA